MQPFLNDERYRRFRDLLIRRAGLAYPEARREDLAHALAQVLQSTGHPNLDILYAATQQDESVWDTLIHHLTIGETYFFRHAAQFEALRHQVFPELIARRRQLRVLRIWSAGCATGEEPYSLAMMLHDLLPDPDTWHITILATDINRQFLERARAGLYGNWSFREEAVRWRDRYFTPEQGRWRLHPSIRRMVTFSQLNLAEPCYPSYASGTSALDLILCRNVTIYFDEATTRQTAERFFEALLPGGWLIVGHAEPHLTLYQNFQVHNVPNAILYRKALDRAGSPRLPITMVAYDPKHLPSGNPNAWRSDRPPQPPTAGDSPLSRGLPDVMQPVGASNPPRATLSERSMAVQRTRVDEPGLWAGIHDALQRNDAPTVERLSHALRQASSDHEALLLRIGRMAANQGAWRYAEQYCEHTLACNPLSWAGYLLIAHVAENQNQLEQALAAYRRVLYLNATVVVAMIGIAGIWEQLGYKREATRSWQAALRHLATLDPDASVPDTDGATVRDLITLVQNRLVR